MLAYDAFFVAEVISVCLESVYGSLANLSRLDGFSIDVDCLFM